MISVVIPSYNCANYLAYAIESALSQSYVQTEIIVVDDGSTDNTKEVVRKYNGRIKYIHQDNKGLPGARNRGITEASGQFIAFLDADDRWRPNKLKYQVQVMETLPAVNIVFSDFSIFDEQGHKEESYFYKAFPFFIESRYTINDIFNRNYKILKDETGEEIVVYYGQIAKYLFRGNFILPSSVVIRKSAIDRVGGFDENYKVAEETEFFLRFCTLNDAAFVDHPMVDYLVKRKGNLTGSSNTELLIKNAINVQLKYISAHPEFYKENQPFIDAAVAKSYARLSYYHITIGLNKSAREEAIRSLGFKPIQMNSYLYWLVGLLPSFIMGNLARTKYFLRSLKRK